MLCFNAMSVVANQEASVQIPEEAGQTRKVGRRSPSPSEERRY